MSYPVPCVSVLVRRKDGQILLRKKGDAWDLLLEPLAGGSDWRSFVAKLCLQQAGLRGAQGKLVGLYSTPLRAAFLVDSFEGEPLAGEGVDAVEWFPLGALPSPLSSQACEELRDAQASGAWLVVR